MTPASRPVKRLSVEGLGANYGLDRNKQLVVTIQAGATGTLISLRPLRTRRALSILATDLYAHLMRCAANRNTLERARKRKEAKQRAREKAAIKRAEKRLLR